LELGGAKLELEDAKLKFRGAKLELGLLSEWKQPDEFLRKTDDSPINVPNRAGGGAKPHAIATKSLPRSGRFCLDTL